MSTTTADLPLANPFASDTPTPDTPADQGFFRDVTMDGILGIHPSDTPQNPRSQACGLVIPTQQCPSRSVGNALTRAFAKRVGGGT